LRLFAIVCLFIGLSLLLGIENFVKNIDSSAFQKIGNILYRKVVFLI